MNSKTIITMASWEERFIEGLRRDLHDRPSSRVVMFYLDAFATRTQENRQIAEAECKAAGIDCVPVLLHAEDTRRSWQSIESTIQKSVGIDRGHPLLDITTMPRDVIWSVLWQLDMRSIATDYVYHLPNAYANDWLSRDPQQPRLLFCMSGLARLGVRTALVVLAGYDDQRIRQLIDCFEPAITRLGIQADLGPYGDDARNKINVESFTGNPRVETFSVDAYQSDHGEAVIRSVVSDLASNYNVLAASLGPKPSAIALYRIQQNMPELGLVYAPSREFNSDYSKGIAEHPLSGCVQPHPIEAVV